MATVVKKQKVRPQKRIKIIVTGQVQGVGFRPHIYAIAKKLHLTGWVLNNAQGVVIEVQGNATDHFIGRMTENLPPLAKIDSITSTDISSILNEPDFQIFESIPGFSTAKMTIDTAVCGACLSELFDPQSRYFGYPFVSCTDCGPRFTITRSLPFDRALTALDVFPMCADCQKAYSDPNNRRFHAQASACSHCGPVLSHAIEDIVQQIKEGKILAIKGLGGYQLVCDAHNEEAILKLRKLKNRPAKPFALMALNIESIKKFLDFSEGEIELLSDKIRPIVILHKKNNQLPTAIAPGLSSLGIMLPYTPLHYLIFHGLLGFLQGNQWLDDPSPLLVVTSANFSSSPLIIDDEAAQTQLQNIADTIVVYNRQIIARADDSVVRVIHKTPCLVRRARGYVPSSIQLPYAIPSTLSLGAHLKNTLCMTRGNEAFVSQHIGDLDNAQTIQFFHDTLDHMQTYLNVEVACIAHDRHPDFYTTHFAHEYAQNHNIPIFAVQHHHAHLAAVAAEHHLTGPMLGLALDGYGYGEKGAAWGGELFLLEGTNFQRLSSLEPLQMPGGDFAAQQPWRMGASVLYQLGYPEKITHLFGQQKWAELLPELLAKNINAPWSSSCGRYFDAASALLGVCYESEYEGHAAMLLESLVTKPLVMPNSWKIMPTHLSLLPLLECLLSKDKVEGANIFHGSLAAALAEWIVYYADQLNIKTVLFSGGCFLNRVLLECLLKRSEFYGIKAYYSRLLPPNDGGICLGQAWVAGNKARSQLCV